MGGKGSRGESGTNINHSRCQAAEGPTFSLGSTKGNIQQDGYHRCKAPSSAPTHENINTYALY